MLYFKKYLSIFAISIMSLGTLSACNTVAGAGEDIEAAGDKIEDSANSNKHY